MENGVKIFTGLLRVHLIVLNKKIGCKVPAKHPVMAWLVEHVSGVLTQYLRDADVRTG